MIISKRIRKVNLFLVTIVVFVGEFILLSKHVGQCYLRCSLIVLNVNDKCLFFFSEEWPSAGPFPQSLWFLYCFPM